MLTIDRSVDGINPAPYGDRVERVRLSGARALAGGGPEDVWSGAALTRPSLGGSAFEVVSSDANDTAAGTGVRTVSVLIMVAGKISSIVVALNGVGAVAGVAADEVLAVDAASVGSGGVAAGEISVRVSGGGAVVAAIDAGKTASDDLRMRAPADSPMYVDVDVSASVNTVRLALEINAAPGGGVGTIFVPIAQGAGALRVAGVGVPAGSTVRVRAEGAAASLVAGSMLAHVPV